jgi:hypothetical protein
MPYVVIDTTEQMMEWDPDWQKTHGGFRSQEEAIEKAKELATKWAPNAYDVAQVILRVQCAVGDPAVKRVV